MVSVNRTVVLWMTLRFIHGKCFVVHVFIKLYKKKKKKDAVFTGVSSQHINTTINLQSIFILFFLLLFPHYLSGTLFQIQFLLPWPTTSGRGKLKLEWLRGWVCMLLRLLVTPGEVERRCWRTLCLHSVNLLGVHHTQVPRLEQI